MRKKFILISSFLSIIYLCINALAFNNEVIKSYDNLFNALSKKITIDKQGLNRFDALIRDYKEQGYREFGREALPYSTNIAIVNASLIVGYAKGKGETKISSSSIEAVREKFNKLYVPLYAHAVPSKMVTKDPQYVLDHDILPSYAKLVGFSKVRADYFKLIDLSEIPENGQLFMLKAITGFASGIALAEGRELLEKEDIETAKTMACWYPKCIKNLGKRLMQFQKEYKEEIKKMYWQK